MKKRLSRGLAALFFLCSFLFPSVSVTTAFADNSNWELINFAPIEKHDGVITTVNNYQTIEMWHYSGGYWGGNIIKIPDTTAFDDAGDLAAALNQTVTFELAIPNEVKAEIAKGSKIIISCDTSDPNIDISKLFYLDGSKGKPEFSIKDDTLLFKACPQLNFLNRFEYKNYIPGLNKSIPIVDPIYGKNRYAIWSRIGSSIGAAEGFIDPNDPTRLGPEGTIHPSQIINSNGHLQNGLKINVDKENGTSNWYDSDDISVGYGTFQNAGAVAMHFWYPMKITFYKINAEEKNDVEVTTITPTHFHAKEGALVNVTVKNNGKKDLTTSLNFFISGVIDKTEMVDLKAGESKVISFGFTAPNKGPISMTAHANKEKAFEESNYDNNKKTVQATIEVPYVPPQTTNCNDTITWNENDNHTITYSCSNHGSHSYTCTHTFTYETKLSTTHTLDPKILKSGYGFVVTVDNSISTRMVSNSGCGSWGNGRSPSKTPVPPTKVEMRLPWKVTNKLGTQSFTVFLNKISSSATTSKFEPMPNPISEIKAKKIYTDVALKGTGKAPYKHNFNIYVSGGGVNGIEFCKDISESITINGGMYEDDFTGSNK